MTEAEQDRVFVNLSDQIHAALMRPVTELRDKLQRKFREIDHECEQQYRQIDSDATLANVNKEFLLHNNHLRELERKWQIVFDELNELDRQDLEKDTAEILKRDPKSKACFDRQREVLQEELQQLTLKRDQKVESRKAKMRRDFPDVFKPPK